MIIQVLFFGILKDLVNSNKIEMNLKDSITISEFKKILSKKFVSINSHSFSIAVNEEYKERDYILNNGDIVALIPPVSGG